MSDTIIKVENLSKSYILSHEGAEKYTALRDVITNKIKNLPSRFFKKRADETTEEFYALRDVSFDIRQGDRVGVIGRNGAGKSTLLKVLSRITEPTSGKIQIKGRVASLLEVGTGFHPELTGRENIFLNGAILGMSKREIRSKFDEIVAFSEVERFLDTPVKRYSSGMYVRLAFAVAAHLEPEVLVVDEVLAVGDAQFQKKCLGKMEDVSKNGGRTVIFVSHDLNAVSQLCSYGVLMQSGTVAARGDIEQVLFKYLNQDKEAAVYVNNNLIDSKRAQIKAIRVVNNEAVVRSDFYYTEPIHIDFDLVINDPTLVADLFVLLLDGRKKRVFACEANRIKTKMRLSIEPNLLVRGNYSIHAFINVPRIEQLDAVEDVCNFRVLDNGSIMSKHGDYDYGSVFGKYSWS